MNKPKFKIGDEVFVLEVKKPTKKEFKKPLYLEFAEKKVVKAVRYDVKEKKYQYAFISINVMRMPEVYYHDEWCLAKNEEDLYKKIEEFSTETTEE